MKSPQGSDSDQEDSFSGSEDMEGSITSGRVRDNSHRVEPIFRLGRFFGVFQGPIVIRN
jgi:hypothetical protein